MSYGHILLGRYILYQRATTYAVFIIFSANCLISRMARGALFLKVTPYKRLLMWIVYSRVTMSLDFVLVSTLLAAFTILEEYRSITDDRYGGSCTYCAIGCFHLGTELPSRLGRMGRDRQRPIDQTSHIKTAIFKSFNILSPLGTFFHCMYCVVTYYRVFQIMTLNDHLKTARWDRAQRPFLDHSNII